MHQLPASADRRRSRGVAWESRRRPPRLDVRVHRKNRTMPSIWVREESNESGVKGQRGGLGGRLVDGLFYDIRRPLGGPIERSREEGGSADI